MMVIRSCSSQYWWEGEGNGASGGQGLVRGQGGGKGGITTNVTLTAAEEEAMAEAAVFPRLNNATEI